ncbi:MAG: phosphomannomutase/phosphoglucomutase [Acidimicrobiia bacterium]|nr:phosphomannomutase/phosphoglucomutase [Acidimicrobiia bacterium]
MAAIDSVFKAYDIRGRVDTGELDEALVRGIGAAFASWSGVDRIAVGYDCRPSSPGLADALSEGITSVGCDVDALGAVPTDLVYFASGRDDIPGVMITASHNPAGYNGIKLCGPGAAPIGVDSGLGVIKQLVIDGVPSGVVRGTIRPVQAVPDYVDHLLGIVDPSAIAALDVVVDGGNGMAGIALERVFDRLDARLQGLYLEPDGTFPNHPANPLEPENLVDLIAAVRESRADLGVAFDGDADRAFFIDDTGEVLSGSTTTALVATWFLGRHPGASIVHNLITSRSVPEIIGEHGGTPVRTRVGHSFIKAVMAETGAVFGGEHSGHYYFADNYRADSGMLAMLVLLQVLSEAGVSLSELRRSVDRYEASGEVNLRVDDAIAAMAAVERGYPTAEVDRLDGLTLSWDDRWLNLRPSNTEPFLRLNVEAGDRSTVAELVRSVSEIVEGL